MQVQDGWQRLGSWKMAACVATVSKDGKWIVCGCSDGKVRILDAESPTLTTNIETNGLHTRKVSALEVSRDSLTVASGSLDGSVIVWSMTTGQRLAGPFNLDQGSNHHGKVSFVGFSRCGSWLAGCVNTPSPSNQHGTVYVLGIHENQLTRRVVVTFNSCVTAILWSHNDNDQQRILVGLEESLAVINPLHGESAARKPIPSLRALSKNGKFMVSGTWQDGIRFWDSATFAEIGRIPSCFPLALSPNDTLVSVSRNAQNYLTSWNLSDVLPECYTISATVSNSLFSSKMYSNSLSKNDKISSSPSTALPISDSRALGLEATETFDIMLLEIQPSPDPEALRKRSIDLAEDDILTRTF